MKKIQLISLIASLFLLFTACEKEKSTFDATGTFEAEEIIVSAEQTGKILQLDIAEGQELLANQTIGQVDVSALNVQKAQTLASVDAIGSKVNDATPQIGILQSQIEIQQAQLATQKAQITTQKAQIQTIQQQVKVLEKEINRTQNLVNADAVPSKQLDDLQGQKSILEKQLATAEDQISVIHAQMGGTNAQIDVINAQIKSAKSSVAIQNKGILSEIAPSQKRIDVIDDQMGRGIIRNMFPGTVLTQYARAGEFTNIGKPLYKIADLSNIILRVYITGNQLPLVKLNQKVSISTDDGKGGFKQTEGTITWISSKAEFTPKTIQTKDERANLVYAMKILVKNDGTYKIGMYGEIKF